MSQREPNFILNFLEGIIFTYFKYRYTFAFFAPDIDLNDETHIQITDTNKLSTIETNLHRANFPLS